MSLAPRLVVVLVVVYLLLMLAPLGLVLGGELPASRGFWREFGAACGFVALAMMGAQFALTARFRWLALRVGQDSMLQFHRQAGLAAFAFVLIHVAAALASEPSHVAFLDPRVNAPRAAALVFVLGALAIVVGLPFLRRRAGVSYEWWRASHGVLAFGAVGIGLAHVLMVGHYVSTPWMQAAWIGMSLGAMALLVHVRMAKPLSLWTRPWRVAQVRNEGGRTWTLALEAEGHAGTSFHPGQFVWLTLGRSPFSLQQHPFTIASSAARSDRIELTIKELGDFTATMSHVRSGTRAWLEGPYGAFSIDAASDAPGFVLVAGGIGVTPMMSMLRTMADRGDRRPVLLVYAARALETVVFREELRELAGRLALELVYVFEEPPGAGVLIAPERAAAAAGHLTPDVLWDVLSPWRSGGERIFVCGPGPMMDAVEEGLLVRGVPRALIASERFDIT